MIKKIALFLIALLPIGLMAQDLKLGHVNSQEILSLMPERITIQQKLDTIQGEYESEQVKMREEYNNKVKDFVDQQKTMPESIKKSRQAEIAALEDRISTFNQQAQTDLQKKYQELTAPMIERVKKAIDDVAAANGYTYVFDLSAQTIVYQSPKSNDITPLVKKKLGISGKEATTPSK